MIQLVRILELTNFFMEQFNSLEIDGKLTKDEIFEVKKMSEKDDILLNSSNEFNAFIESDYRYANENYLEQNGKIVKDLQIKLGFKGNEIDGLFSKETFLKLIDYQKNNGLIVDGLAGPKTNSKLFGMEDEIKKTILNYYKNKKENNDLGKNSENNNISSALFNTKGVLFLEILKMIKLSFSNTRFSLNSGSTSLAINDYSLSDNENNVFTKMFYSEPLEKNGSMTFCSRTARKNLYKLGVNNTDVAWGDSALSSFNMNNDNENYVNNFSLIPKSANVLDLYIDTTSKYEHRAVAYKKGNSWFVLDPYANKIHNKMNNRLPIPISEYGSKYTFMGVFPKKSTIV